MEEEQRHHCLRKMKFVIGAKVKVRYGVIIVVAEVVNSHKKLKGDVMSV